MTPDSQVLLRQGEWHGCVIHPLAYFKTPEDAQTCLDFLDKLAGSRFVLDTLEAA